ncbi:MAG: helix-turn-helix domain-containing protein [Pseudomonadota bacterium]|nr:helix-turn-helix domain-containing protein [Pseudomonadota bacterium]
MTQTGNIPDIDRLPPSALLTYDQLAAATGFSTSTVKRWAGAGRGPRMTRVEGLPRFKVGDVRAWLETENA